MYLQMNPQDAAERQLQDGERVCAFNDLGEVTFVLKITTRVQLVSQSRKGSGGWNLHRESVRSTL